MSDDDNRLPRATETLIGHADAEATLLAAALSGRLPHAWLIGGPHGVGKATLAYRFARFLLSGAAEATSGLFAAPPTTLHVDPSDRAFRLVASGAHPDLLIVDRTAAEDEGRGKDRKRGSKRPPRDLGVDVVRRIDPFLRLTPALGRWRVVVVDEGHELNRNSANAMLKILEEPPAHSVLLLLCDRPGALPATIRSRCRRLELSPLTEEQVATAVAGHAPDMSPTDRLAVARLADGSVGAALDLVEHGGLQLYRTLIGVFEGLPRLDLREMHHLGDQLSAPAAETSYRVFGELMQWWLERLVRTLARGDEPMEVTAGEAALMRRLGGPGAGLDRWVEVWEKTGRLFRRAESANLDRKQTLLQAFAALQAAAAG